jgi:hypothetical protein
VDQQQSFNTNNINKVIKYDRLNTPLDYVLSNLAASAKLALADTRMSSHKQLNQEIATNASASNFVNDS